MPPLLSFVTWNRLGLTAGNLAAVLASQEDFELHIVDNNSQDDTWSYIESIRDERIKSRTRFPANMGPVYASNYTLSKRKKGQYYFTIDNDVHILTQGWISKFLKAFEVFPELGLLGAVRSSYYKHQHLPAVLKRKEGLSCLFPAKGFVEGCCQCLRPEVLDMLGYWDEENCMGDMELCGRIMKYTPYRIAYFPSVEIDQKQYVSCGSCIAAGCCSFISGPGSHSGTATGTDTGTGTATGNATDTGAATGTGSATTATVATVTGTATNTGAATGTCSTDTGSNRGAAGGCFRIYQSKYANPQFRNRFYWKYEKSLKEMESGIRTAYCASIHDEESLKLTRYNKHSAEENFRFYSEK